MLSIGAGIDTVHMGRVQQGIDLYRAFHSFGPSRARILGRSRIIPPIVVDLGELAGVMYRSDKGQPGQPRTYIHRMEDPPRLVSNAEGTQLYIVGGSYRVTSRGIEG
jgi:hypothetical protein